MKFVVSACLLGENCKYNGGNNRCQRVIDFIKDHEAVPVCPEMMAGLPTPRLSAEICHGLVVNSDGESVDAAFRKGAELATRLALEEGAQVAILQPRSPSCSCKQVYDGTFSQHLIPGKGVFAQMLEDHHIKVLDPDDL